MTNPAFLPSWSTVADQIGGLLFSRGIQFGVQFGTAQFSTSASPLAIYTEHTARFTAPNTVYALLIHPNSSNGPITLGLPLGNRVLAKMEQDYDEEFTLDTQVRIKEIGEGTPKPQTSTSYLDPDPAASTDTQVLQPTLK